MPLRLFEREPLRSEASGNAPASGSGGTDGAPAASGSGTGATNGGGTGATNGSGTGATSGSGTGAAGGSESGGDKGGSDQGGTSSTPGDALGAFPFEDSPVTKGGTITFSNIGAPGSWPRRLDREAGDPACDYKDGNDTWGGHCCMTSHETESTDLAPFDEEMTLIVKAIDIKQLAVYQPSSNEERGRTGGA